MPLVKITGCKYGLEKISMTKAIQKHAGCGLAKAKGCTDAVLDGKMIDIEVADLDTAHLLASELNKLNAISYVV